MTDQVAPDSPPHDDAYIRYFLRHIAYMAIFGTLLGVTMLTCHFIYRQHFGLPLNILPTLKIFSIWLATAFGIFALPWRMQRWLVLRPYLIPFCTLAVFLLPLLVFITGNAALILFPCIAAPGLIGMLRYAHFNRMQWIVLLVLTLLYGVYFFIWSNGFYYERDLLVKVLSTYSLSALKEVGSLGTLLIDYYFGLSIIHMIQAWGTITAGLDGLVFFPYHTGSHVWFAAIGRLGGAEPITAVPISQLALVFPAMLFMFLLCMLCVRRHLHSSYAFYLLVGVIMVRTIDTLDGNIFSYLNLQFNLSLVILFAAFPYLYYESKRLFTTRKILFTHCIVISICVLLIGVCKLHVGVLYGVVAGYFILRCYLPRWFIFGIFLPAFFVLMVIIRNAVFAFTFNDGTFDLDWVMAGMVQYVWIYVPAFVYCRYLNVQYAKGTSGFVMDPGKDFHHDLFWIFFVSAVMPLLYPGGWNMLWFFMTVYWVVMIIACTHPYCEAEFLGDCFRDWMRQCKKDVFDQARLTNQQARKYIIVFGWLLLCVGHIVTRFDLMLGNWNSNLGQTETYLHTRPTLLELSVQQIHEHGGDPNGLAVFVPPGNTAFWTYGPNHNARPLYLPALSGIPMLLGLPPANMPCAFDCKLEGMSYEYYGEDAHSDNRSDKEICEHARRQHVKRVFILNDAYHPEANRTLECQ